MPEMITAIIDSIRVSLTSTQRIVILRELNGDRYLPIWIGPFETESITIALQEVEVSRPQTHDLIKNIFQAMDTRLTHIEINALHEDVFYGKLVLEKDGKLLEVDARPSDAIALAVRYHVPILVEQTIFTIAGTHPEIDIRSSFVEKLENETRPTGGQEKQPEINPEQLTVFENFIDNLHLDDLDKPASQDSPDQKPSHDKPEDKNP
jgi:bifunctional DNase/RNase